MSHLSYRCMHMDARTYATEMLMRLDRFWTKFEFDYFRKNTQPFSMCFKQIIFRLKFIVCSYEIYIKTGLNKCSHSYSSCKASDLKIQNLLALHFCMIMSSPNWQILKGKCGVACFLYLVVTLCCFDTRTIIIIRILY